MVGIIAANNLRVSPYVLFYTRILKEAHVDFEVVVPDRNPQLQDDCDFCVRKLPWNSKAHPLVRYTSYAHAVKKLALERYDFLILLTTMNAVFCYPWLSRHYKGKYLIDIRDYTYENNAVYRRIEGSAIKKASATVISSSKFREFLPSGKYYVCHNMNETDECLDKCFSPAEDRIIIGYVGAIAYGSQCSSLMQMISRDERFALHFYGSGIAEKELKLQAKALNCDRIQFFGPYKPEQKAQILQKVHILFNAYGNGRPLVDYALSNKLYDSLRYHIPLLTSPHTFMTEMGGPLAFPIDLTADGSLKELWNWYHQLDAAAVDAYADQKYRELMQEQIATRKEIEEVILQQYCKHTE